MICRELNGFDIKIKCLAIEKIPHSGKSEILLNYYGIDSKKIAKTVHGMLED